jgi:hypothetical protein
MALQAKLKDDDEDPELAEKVATTRMNKRAFAEQREALKPQPGEYMFFMDGSLLVRGFNKQEVLGEALQVFSRVN